MLSTATALIEAVGNSIMEDEVMDLARVMLNARDEMSQDQFAKAMYLYSGVIASNVADKVVKILLNETELKELMLSIDELEQMRNLVLEENN
jgi:hypothetical protein